MRISASACAGLLLLLCGTASISAQKLDLSVDPKDSSIRINLDGAQWFAASVVQLGEHSRLRPRCNRGSELTDI